MENKVLDIEFVKKLYSVSQSPAVIAEKSIAKALIIKLVESLQSPDFDGDFKNIASGSLFNIVYHKFNAEKIINLELHFIIYDVMNNNPDINIVNWMILILDRLAKFYPDEIYELAPRFEQFLNPMLKENIIVNTLMFLTHFAQNRWGSFSSGNFITKIKSIPKGDNKNVNDNLKYILDVISRHPDIPLAIEENKDECDECDECNEYDDPPEYDVVNAQLASIIDVVKEGLDVLTPEEIINHLRILISSKKR